MGVWGTARAPYGSPATASERQPNGSFPLAISLLLAPGPAENQHEQVPRAAVSPTKDLLEHLGDNQRPLPTFCV